MDRHSAGKLNSYLMRLKREYKNKENRNKPTLVSPDVIKSADFIFSVYSQERGEGDGGQLLLAKKKGCPGEKYIVKQAFSDCGCNEYVYYKTACLLGLCVPEVKLLSVSPDEKRKYFRNETGAAVTWLNITHNIGNSPDRLRESGVKNPDDLFAFRALYNILGEEDSFETVAADGKLYKIDNAAAFNLNYYTLDSVCILLANPDGPDREKAARLLEAPGKFSQYSLHQTVLDRTLKNNGEQAARVYLDTYRAFSELRDTDFDPFLETLCYFYPDIIGEYYRHFFQNRREECQRFLTEARA